MYDSLEGLRGESQVVCSFLLRKSVKWHQAWMELSGIVSPLQQIRKQEMKIMLAMKIQGINYLMEHPALLDLSHGPHLMDVLSQLLSNAVHIRRQLNLQRDISPA